MTVSTISPLLTNRQRTLFRLILAATIIALGFLFSTSSTAHSESAQYRQFRSDYGLLSIELLNNPAEVATVQNFSYTKDAATFNLQNGKLYFLRYMNERPTTALFIGQGNVSIEIPHHAERENLRQIGGDSLLQQSFDVSVFRFADDFDKIAREKFTFAATKLEWADYNKVMKAQGENYFGPSIYLQRDPFVQLIWSAMDRKADGFFWVDFGRFAFSYDPNRPEQVEVLCEREAADEYLTVSARFQSSALRPSSDGDLSRIPYPMKLVDRSAAIELGGVDGTHIKKADVSLKVTVQSEQLRFIPFYIDRHQNVDTVWINDVKTEFWNRNDQSIVYLFPAKPVSKGEELTIRILYHGNDYMRMLPWLDDGSAVYTQVEYDAPKGFSYFVPGMSKVEIVGGRQKFSSQYDLSVRDQRLVSIATGYDTVTVKSASGFPITFVKVRAYSRGGLPDAKYQSMVVKTFDAMSAILGNPPATFAMTVLPYGTRQAPGVASIPQQSTDLDQTGGFVKTAALALAEQWYGITAQPTGSREEWVLDGMKQSIAQMAVQQVKTSAEMFSEIGGLERQVVLGIDRQADRPLAGHLDWREPKEQSTGQVESLVNMTNQMYRMAKAGVLFNQLRFELYDLSGEKGDASYAKLLRELTARVSSASYTNADLAAIMSKHTGRDMTSFFNTFVYGGDLPQIAGTYQMNTSESGQSIQWKLTVSNVPADFSAPVVIRLSGGADSEVIRQTLVAGDNSFQLQGIKSAVTDVVFNEFYSLLSRDNVKKGK